MCADHQQQRSHLLRYHRRGSQRTQTHADTLRMVATGELWGAALSVDPVA